MSVCLGIGLSAYVTVLRPAVISTVIMALAVLALSLTLPAAVPGAALLVVKILTGAAFYAGALWFLFRERVLALVRLRTQLRGGGPAPAIVS